MSSVANPAGADTGPLYAARRKIYPQSVSGTFRTIKWALMGVCLCVYYFLPFVRWHRGPGAPSQAVLIDFPHRRFYFFFIEIWPQEFYYITGLLIMAAMILFLMNAIGGRLWCGYLCPQTVWTDLFYAVERWIEGDRRERIHKDKGRMTLRHAGEIFAKHSIWLMIAWWTGGAWVLYFADAPTLVKQLATLQAPAVAYLWIAILTFTTYALAGHMREQVCVYMCPWPRIQAALTDEWALNVMYRYDRGEPRISLKKAEELHAKGQRAGDCIDCNQCVAVCPTGIDIRDGAQLGCIMCGLCIDACDAVMTKIGRPTRLIAYETDLNIRRRLEGKPEIYRVIRPRTIIYAAIIALVGIIMLYSLATRRQLSVTTLHDRNPLFVTLKDGAIRNGHTVRVVNKSLENRTLAVAADGIPSAQLQVVGASEPVVTIGPDRTSEWRIFLTVPPQTKLDRVTPIRFRITDRANGDTASVGDHFFAN